MAFIPFFHMKRLYSSKTLPAQLLRYGSAGGIAAIADFGSFYVLVSYLSVYYPFAIFLSFSLGTFVNFLICNYYIFDRGALQFQRAFIRHYLSSTGGLATNMIVVYSLVEIIPLGDLLAAKIIAMVVAFFVNFSLIKFYAFNSRVSISDKLRGRK